MLPVWPGINRTVRQWAQTCIACQKLKISRHVKAPLGKFITPDSRFAHVHLDIVGPLPPSNGHAYLLTCVDRYTRWPIAIPIPDQTAETVARAFVGRWVATFGAPSTVTTDRGHHLELRLFSELIRLLDTNRVRTTTANRMVERFHRQLRSALKAHDSKLRA